MITETLKVEKNRSQIVYNSLIQYGCIIKADNNPYLGWKLAHDSFTIMYYTSGKLVIQGNGDISPILKVIGNMMNSSVSTPYEASELTSTKGSYVSHIGADEVGKGDYFGPLVVGACYVPGSVYTLLEESGINDSKKITDKNIYQLYELIKVNCEYAMQVIEPYRFNTMYQEYKNIAKLLAQVHAENIKTLIDKLNEKGLGYNKVVIDQFSSNKGRLASVLKGISFEQMHKAESVDLPTACASIIARRYFLDYFEKMNSEYSFEFPKGATFVIDSGRKFVSKYGVDTLKKVAKVSFKTTTQILGF